MGGWAFTPSSIAGSRATFLSTPRGAAPFFREDSTSKQYDSRDSKDSNIKAEGSGSDTHPVGTGIGAAGGAVAGAAVGTAVGSPAGTLVGGAIGAAAGALTGQAVSEGVNPTEEDAYWRENYGTRDYV